MAQNDNWPKPRHPKAKDFGYISDAFAWCREMNKPIVVRLPDGLSSANRLAKLYPSGSFHSMTSRNTRAAIIHYVRSED